MASIAPLTKLRVASFMLTGLVCIIAFIGWGSMNSWQFNNLTLYTIFPLFGLLAFSILWCQYAVLSSMKFFKVTGKELSQYFEVTGWIFLIAIFLHPGLLVWQLWRDGFGLPPESYLNNYVAPGLAWAVLLGTLSFLIFLSYELRRWFSGRSWWKFFTYASDIAALAILVHSLRLGGALQSGWFRYIWLFYGLTLIISLYYLRIVPLLRK